MANNNRRRRIEESDSDSDFAGSINRLEQREKRLRHEAPEGDYDETEDEEDDETEDEEDDETEDGEDDEIRDGQDGGGNNVGQNRIQIADTNFLETLYSNNATKDFIFVSETGSEVKCHKLVLFARSSWFSTMLQNPEIIAVREGRFQIDGLSEWSLNHLVKYLYGIQIPVAELTPIYTHELLQLHAYEFSGLAQKIKDFLMEKDSEWFLTEGGADALLKSYFCVQTIDNDELMRNLSDHLFQIIKSLPTENIRSSQCFREVSRPQEIANLCCKLHEDLQLG